MEDVKPQAKAGCFISKGRFDCMFVLLQLALLSCVSVRSLNRERLLIISEWVWH